MQKIFNKNNNFIAFYHIPKTAGMSVKSFLDKQYAGYKYGPGGAGKFFTKHAFWHKDREILCAHGHEAHFAPFWDTKRKCVIFTFIRNPIDRIISHFNYERHKQAILGRIITKLPMSDLFELDEFWETRYEINPEYINYGTFYPWVSNFYCRALSRHTMLSKIKSEDPHIRLPVMKGSKPADYSGIVDTSNHPDEDMFKEALQVIESGRIVLNHPFGDEEVSCKIVICITEQMNRSIDLLTSIFDWESYYPPRINSNNIRNNLSDKALENLTKYNKYDIFLYNLATKRFNSLLKERGLI